MEIKSARAGRQKILQAAENLFIEHGFEAVSIRDIARQCEVTNAALYYHFPSKEALFFEVLEQHATHIHQKMRQAGESGNSFRMRVLSTLLEYAQIAGDQRSPLFLLRKNPGAIKNVGEKQHTRLMHAMLLPLEDLLQAAVQAGELKGLGEGYSMAALLVGMLHGQILYRKECLHYLIEPKDVEMTVQIFWEGLACSA